MAPPIIIKICEIFENFFAVLQGKGVTKDSPRKEVELIYKYLGKNFCVGIDVGGNKGEYSAALREYFPSMEIHIFEPSKVNVSTLKNRFSTDSKIHISDKALSNSERELVLHANSPGSGLSSLEQRRLTHFDLSFDSQETVTAVRFFDYWESILKRVQIDIVKLDIEGHELKALEGMGDAIKNIKIIQFEFGGCNIDSKTFFQDFWYFLSKLNFQILRPSPFGLIEISTYRENLEFFSTTNYLAVNQRLLNPK